MSGDKGKLETATIYANAHQEMATRHVERWEEWVTVQAPYRNHKQTKRL